MYIYYDRLWLWYMEDLILQASAISLTMTVTLLAWTAHKFESSNTATK